MRSWKSPEIWAPALALLVLGCALYLPRLGASGLWDPWEPKYAQSAREMSERGNWIVPYYRGDPRLNKPPMTYWLIRGSQTVFGPNETGSRLPSAALAVVCAVILGLAFAVRGRSLEGFLAGAALLTGPQWLLLGRFATPDIPLAAFLGIGLALVIALPAAGKPRDRAILLVLVAMAIAAAGLTDGMRGLLLPVWAVLGWGALRCGPWGALSLTLVAAVYHAGQLLHSVPLNVAAIGLGLGLALAVLIKSRVVPLGPALAGVGLVLLPVGSWLLAAYRLAPEDLSILRYKHALNLGESVGQHTGPHDYVLRVVVVGALPWVAAAVAGLSRGFGRSRDELTTLLAGTWLGFMLFFTLAEAQMGHFYGVMQPAFAGLAGIGLVALIRKPGWAAVAGVAALCASWVLFWREPSRLLETATVKSNFFRIVDPTMLTTIAVLAWSLLVVVAFLRRRESWAVACVLPAAVVAGYLAFHLVPALETKKSLATIWHAYLDHRRVDEPIGLLGKAKDSAFYYSNNAIVRMKEPPELREFLSDPGGKYLVVPAKTLARLQVGSSGSWQVLVRSHPSHVLARFDPGEAVPLEGPGKAP